MSCRFQMIRIYLLRLLEITYSHLTTCPKSVKSSEHIDSSFFFIMMYYEIKFFTKARTYFFIWIDMDSFKVITGSPCTVFITVWEIIYDKENVLNIKFSCNQQANLIICIIMY